MTRQKSKFDLFHWLFAQFAIVFGIQLTRKYKRRVYVKRNLRKTIQQATNNNQTDMKDASTMTIDSLQSKASQRLKALDLIRKYFDNDQHEFCHYLHEHEQLSQDQIIRICQLIKNLLRNISIQQRFSN